MFFQTLKRSLVFGALTFLFLACNSSFAGVELGYTSPPAILQGGNGSFDVYLKNLDLTNPSQDILSFDFTIEDTPASGITFTSLAFPVANYIYGGLNESNALNNSLALQIGPGGSSITGLDLWDLVPGSGKILAAGETVLLATIQFSVAANATPGDHFLTFTASNFLRYVDPFDVAPVDNLSTATPNITVLQSVSAVPEPTGVIVFLTLTGLVVFKRRRSPRHC